MGGKVHCCVINCTSGRRKARNNAEQLSFFSFPVGDGDSSVVSRSTGLVIERSRVRIPAGTAGEFSSPGSTFCADSYFGIRSTPVLPQ